MEMFGITGLLPLSGASLPVGATGGDPRYRKKKEKKSNCSRLWEAHYIAMTILSLPVCYMFLAS
ncbi:hypothetical protein [Photorhabdus aegyptia]|uniref:Uncharacterized protein n=1 Tax=Photorhabdus aegyptia TaxID=2805098 RepID=A0A022PLN2_9GAMM|nr:hypothetical protein [Photorhabdus aegyptia]EYU16521.1 hypothetical protein BA1DRAFT_00805 [Photorhabdus aegyptia]